MASATQIILAPITHRKVTRLQKGCRQIEARQTNLTMAFDTLCKTSVKIDATISMLEKQDFNAHNDKIDALKLTPEYKASLKASLEESRKTTIDTLKPLLDKAEKLKGNMMVTQERSIHFIAIIKAQAEVMRAGEVQVSLINGLQQTGQDMAQRIEELMVETERINHITKDALAPFNQQLPQSSSGSFLERNPLIQSSSA